MVACDVPGPMTTLAYPLGSEEELTETAKLVGETGRRCLPLHVDVRIRQAVEAAVEETVEEFGRLDVLVANAGVVSTALLVDTSDHAWGELVATNLTGAFHSMRAVIPVMRRQQYGRIIATSSMGGRMGIPNLAAYNATKWGVIGMAKSLALEVARDGITVNVVCPTTAATPMVLNRSMFTLYSGHDVESLSPELIERFARINPIPQPWIEPEDVSRAVLYLAADRGVLTGVVMDVSLGSSARMH